MSNEITKAKNFIENEEYKKAFDLAKKRHRKNKIEEYLKILDLLIQKDYLPALEEKGQYYLYYEGAQDTDDYGEKYFNKYLKLQPHSINVICGKAMALSKKNNMKSAISLMDKALNSYDNFSEDEKPRITLEEVWIGKIELMIKDNQDLDALKELDKFEEKFNDNKKMILFKGIILSKTNKNEEALNYLDKSLQEERTILAVNAKGDALYNLKRYSDALESYNTCIEYESEIEDLDLITNFNSKAAFCAIELENYEEAIKYLNKTIEMLNKHGRLPDNLEKIYQHCSFEKDRILKQYNIKDQEFHRFKFLSSKVAIIFFLLMVVGYFILTYLGY